MTGYMDSYPSYATEAWRVEFEETLAIDPSKLVNFVAQQPSARDSVEHYISACLERLTHTGIGKGDDQFITFWVHRGQAWEVAFPRRYYRWAGLWKITPSLFSRNVS